MRIRQLIWLMFEFASLTLTSCLAPPAPAGTSDTLSATSTSTSATATASATWSIAATSGVTAYVTGGATTPLNSLVYAQAHVGDEPDGKYYEIAMTFPLASLAGHTLTGAISLTLSFDYCSSATCVSSFTLIRVERISARTSYYADVVTDPGFEYTYLPLTDTSANALANKASVVTDITNLANAAIVAGETSLTLRIRGLWGTDNDGVTDGIQFYGNLLNATLAPYVPRISGTY